MSSLRMLSGSLSVTKSGSYSITAAAQHIGVHRDAVLDAVRSGSLAAERDRRGVLRIAPAALIRFAAGAPKGSPARRAFGNVTVLGVITPERLPFVLAQHERQVATVDEIAARRTA